MSLEGQADGPSTKRRRNLSLSTVVILLLAAFAGIAYYAGTPPPLPTASSTGSCSSQGPEIVIPDGVGSNPSIKFQPPTLTVFVGANNTVVWKDQDTTAVHAVISVSVPPGGVQWDFEKMTSSNSYCVTLTAPGTYTYEMYLPYVVEGTIIVKTAG